MARREGLGFRVRCCIGLLFRSQNKVQGSHGSPSRGTEYSWGNVELYKDKQRKRISKPPIVDNQMENQMETVGI